MTAELIITRGLPGSGKSTYATAWVAEDPENRVRVNRDEIRYELFNMWYPVDDEHGTVKEKEDRVTGLEITRIDQALRRGKSVISDNTHLNPVSFNRYGKIAKRNNATFDHRDFPLDIEETIRRNNARDRVVPEAVIRDMAKRYMGPNGEFHLFPGSYPTKPFVAPAQPGRMAVLVDMDGSLADTRTIKHYVQPEQGKYKNFDAFHRSSLFVPSNPQVEQMVRDAAAAGYAIVVTTARSEAYREVTQKWLDDHGIPYENIFMRRDGDMRHDYEVKSDMLRSIRKHYDVVGAIDDNPQAVGTWQKNNIHVTVVPGFHPGEVSDDEVIKIDNILARGGCMRCGRPLKNGKSIGDRCARLPLI